MGGLWRYSHRQATPAATHGLPFGQELLPSIREAAATFSAPI